jgi:hypothetical protein
MSKVFKAVGKAVTGVVKGVVKAVTGVVKAVVSAVSSVVNFVLQPFMGIFGGAPQIDDGAEQARQKGVLIQTTGSIEAIPVIYGHRQVGGVVAYVETGSTDNKYLYVAYVFSEGLVNGLHDLYINDIQIKPSFIPDLNAGKEVLVDDADNKGRFKNRVILRWSPGRYFANATSSNLGSQVKSGMFAGAPNFTANMRFNGLATLFARYEWKEFTDQTQADKNPFDGSIPRIRIGILGRKVASLLDPAQSNYEYEASGYQEIYTTNPAEIILDYLRNPRYGKGLKNSEIDWPSFRTARNKLNTRVDYNGSVSGPIVTCNYVLDTNQTIMNNIKILLQGARAYMPYVQGKYKLKIEDAGNPDSITSGAAFIVAECSSLVQIRDESLIDNQYDLMGDITYTGIDRNSKFNQVTVSWVDPTNAWSIQQVTYPESEGERQSYIQIDGGRVNKQEVTFPTLTNYYMARDMARLLFNKSRFQESCSVTVSSQAMELEPGDLIRIQAKILDFADIPWRVVSIGYNDDYTVDLNCVRCPDFMYPYTTAGERDIVLPIFVPRGSTIYLPENSTYDYGLYPPVTVPIADDVPPLNVDLNPIPTDPTDPTSGGGVGEPTSPENQTGQNIIAQPVLPPNPARDYIDVTSVTYERTGASTYYARLRWTQPNNAVYAGVSIWFKQIASATWTRVEFNDAPGANGTIIGRLGPLTIYPNLDLSQSGCEVITRVRYSTSPTFSDQFTRFSFAPNFTSGYSDNPQSDKPQAVSNLPNLNVVVASRRDNVPSVLAIVPDLTTPRSLNLTVNQRAGSGGEIANSDIIGVSVFYKNTIETAYRLYYHEFPTSYAPGDFVTFAFPGSLGNPGDPSDYNMIFRFYYRDGRDSTRQHNTIARVQGPTGILYPWDALSASTKRDEDVGATSIQLISPEEEAEILNTNILLSGFFADTSTGRSSIRLEYLPPADGTNRIAWRGVVVRYRPLLEGRTPEYITLTDRRTTVSGVIGPVILLEDIKFDQIYQIVVTPLISVAGGDPVESTRSNYLLGYVSNAVSRSDYPRDGNWINSALERDVNETSVLLPFIREQFAITNPVVDVVKFTGTAVNGTVARDMSTSWQISQYVTIEYDHTKFGATYNGLYVYMRRAKPAGTTYAKYFGYSQWERILFTETNDSGTVTINLRPPAGASSGAGDEFNAYHGVPGYSQPLKATSWKGYNILPMDDRNFNNVEILLIANLTTGVSDQAVRLRLGDSGGLSAQVQFRDFLLTQPPQIVDVAPYNNDFDPGFFRRLDDYRNRLPLTQIQVYVNNRGFEISFPQKPITTIAAPTGINGGQIY